MSKSKKHQICLPVEGSPYVIGNFDELDSEDFRKYQKVVQGSYQHYCNKFDMFLIHPMFCSTEPRPPSEFGSNPIDWNSVNVYLKDWFLDKKMRSNIYINENGMNACSPNMATIVPTKIKYGCPNLFGEILIEVTEKEFTKYFSNLPVCDLGKNFSEEEEE